MDLALRCASPIGTIRSFDYSTVCCPIAAAVAGAAFVSEFSLSLVATVALFPPIRVVGIPTLVGLKIGAGCDDC